MYLKKQKSNKGNTKKHNQKMRRGFKKCQSCGNEMHIHKKICESCNHEHIFIAKQKQKPSQTNILDYVKTIHDGSQNIIKKVKKVPKRYFSSIGVFKKSFLYKNESNFDKNIIQQTQNIKEESIFNNFQSNFNYQFPLNQIIVDQENIKSGQFHELKNKQGQLIYFGCAILCLTIKNGIILISLELDEYQEQLFSKLHKYGIQYNGNGLICLIYNFKLHYIKLNQGPILQIKFQPQSQFIIGTINGSGTFTIIQLNEQKNNEIKCIVELQNQLFCCFDWFPTCDYQIALGDQEGNIYIIKIDGQKFQIINFLEQYHNGIVKDIQFYYHNDNNQPLLLTGGYDGIAKIINPLNNNEIFNKVITAKGIKQVKWDIGGKFIIVITDDPNYRALIFSFFSIMKKQTQIIEEKNGLQTQLLEYAEKRQIQSLTGDDQTQVCALNCFHNKAYFASKNGNVYTSEIEHIRKQAIKKDKKQQTQYEKIHFGQVKLENNNIYYYSEQSKENKDQQESLGDWSQGYHFIDVDENGKIILGNILGILIIK